MGLGPSIKMTTLHHFDCPLTRALREDKDLEFCGIVVDGVSEVFDDKVYTAKRSADLAQAMRADAAIVAIDGWGNHHVDFVNVIEQLGLKDIPSVALSFVGLQGRLVCSNEYVDCLIDFNKGESGYENCVVGYNNLTYLDAKKAVAILKSKLRKVGKPVDNTRNLDEEKVLKRLTVKEYPVKNVEFGDKTEISRGTLTIDRNLKNKYKDKLIKDVNISIVSPGEYDFFVNSNLDFSPIAVKERGELGQGITRLLKGVTTMLTGVEDKSGFQPSNIGSSEGLLRDQVTFDREGTPSSQDYLLHIDFLFEEGQGRTEEGLMAAHRIGDMIVNDIRSKIKDIDDMPYERKEYYDLYKPGKRKVVLIKIVSGLGNMYDTSMFPFEPGGFLGSRNMMNSQNVPYVISPNQCKDGAIHSLL